MKRVLLFICSIILCFTVVGCGSESDTFYVDNEKLEAEGYVKFGDIAYGKVEDDDGKPTLHLVYYQKDPVSAIYLISMLSAELKISDDFVIVWDGKDYVFNEEVIRETGSTELFDFFPADWRETFEELQASNDEEEFFFEQMSGTISKDVKKYANEYLSGLQSEKESIEEQEVEKEDPEEVEEETEKESDMELIDKFEYSYDEDNSVTVGVLQDTETKEIAVYSICYYSDLNIGLMQYNFAEICLDPLKKAFEVKFIAYIGENTYSFMADNGEAISNNVPIDDIGQIPEEYAESFEEMLKDLHAFYVKYGIAEKADKTLVYEDENVIIYFKGIGDKGVEFLVENLTDIPLTIQAGSIAINGISTNSIMMSDDVAPKSTGTVVARCNDFSKGLEVEKVSGELRVIDWATDSYSAVFSEVPIE